jgi:uncharacterized protein (DUF2235 family)
MKNIAIFCDGTWQNLSQRFPTNVTRLARAVAPAKAAQGDDPEITQVIFYDDGVGVGEGVANEATRLIGGALGKGLDRKICEAYEFLCLNYCAGDRIFLFGFSRGAYTARSLAGLLRKCWILRRENIGSVEAAVEIYRNHSKDAVETQLFKRNMCYPAEAFTAERSPDPKQAGKVVADSENDWGCLHYIGVWDTVGALGVPQGLPFADALNDRYRFHDTNLSRFVLSARHAVSIDERRATFPPTLWTNIDDLNANAGASAIPFEQRPYQQSWYPGRHSAIGGGEEDHGVSIPPLLWIGEGARMAGLAFDDALTRMYTNSADPTAPFAEQTRAISDFLITITGEKDRDGPKEFREISDAARTRWRALKGYRPKPIEAFAQQLNPPTQENPR